MPLNNFVQESINNFKIHSFTITENKIANTYGKELNLIEIHYVLRLDMNIKKCSVGNEKHKEVYDLSEVVKIRKRNINKISHFKRDECKD